MNKLAIYVKKVFLLALCTIFVITMSVVLNACSSENTSTSDNSDNAQTSSNDSADGFDFLNFEIISSNENGRKIEVVTTFGKISYSSAFTDAIIVKAEGSKESARVNFYANLSIGETPIYSIIYGKEEASSFGKLKLDGSETPVLVQVAFYEAPANMSKDDTATFNATQETFNDVVSSLKDDSRFTEIK
jgi:hypothetical protein